MVQCRALGPIKGEVRGVVVKEVWTTLFPDYNLKTPSLKFL